MKRAAGLMPMIVHPDNLREAFLRAMRGKACKHEAQQFRAGLEEQLALIAEGLSSATYDFGHYRTFEIFDPKRRTICAAPFAMRVALHAMMRVCHPVFDAYQPYDSYACRLGKGSLAAVRRAQGLACRYDWFVKLDVVKYFDSIRHDVLMGQLERLFKDEVLLCNFYHLVESYDMEPGCGLPIGNLSSQYFANHYLAVADHHAEMHLRIEGKVRYMDDIILLGSNRTELVAKARDYCDYIKCRLGMEMHAPVVNRTAHGLPFLGYVIHPHYLRLSQRSRHRLRSRLGQMQHDVTDGRSTQAAAHDSATAMLAFAAPAETRRLRRDILLGMLS